MFDCACQNKPTNYPLRQSPNPTVCHSVGITEFVLKKLNHEESADNTNAKIILPLNYLTKTVKVEKCFILLLVLIILVLLLCPSKFRKKNTTISNNFDPVICPRCRA